MYGYPNVSLLPIENRDNGGEAKFFNIYDSLLESSPTYREN